MMFRQQSFNVPIKLCGWNSGMTRKRNALGALFRLHLTVWVSLSNSYVDPLSGRLPEHYSSQESKFSEDRSSAGKAPACGQIQTRRSHSDSPQATLDTPPPPPAQQHISIADMTVVTLPSGSPDHFDDLPATQEERPDLDTLATQPEPLQQQQNQTSSLVGRDLSASLSMSTPSGPSSLYKAAVHRNHQHTQSSQASPADEQHGQEATRDAHPAMDVEASYDEDEEEQGQTPATKGAASEPLVKSARTTSALLLPPRPRKSHPPKQRDSFPLIVSSDPPAPHLDTIRQEEQEAESQQPATQQMVFDRHLDDDDSAESHLRGDRQAVEQHALSREESAMSQSSQGRPSRPPHETGKSNQSPSSPAAVHAPDGAKDQTVASIEPRSSQSGPISTGPSTVPTDELHHFKSLIDRVKTHVALADKPVENSSGFAPEADDPSAHVHRVSFQLSEDEQIDELDSEEEQGAGAQHLPRREPVRSVSWSSKALPLGQRPDSEYMGHLSAIFPGKSSIRAVRLVPATSPLASFSRAYRGHYGRLPVSK